MAVETVTATQPLVLLDPTVEPEPEMVRPAPRPASLAGLTVGLIENGKLNAAEFLDRLGARLRAEHGVREVVWIHKRNAGRPALPEQYDGMAAEAQAAIAAIGD